MTLPRLMALAFGLANCLAACQAPSAEKQPTAAAPPAKPAPAPPADTGSLPAAAAKSYPYKVPPVNQLPQEPALQAFVQKIVRACTTRRTKDLLALVDDSVVVSYGGGIQGKPGFITDFLNSSQPGSGFGKLLRVIRLGGTVTHNSVGQVSATFPYLQDGALYQGQLAQVELDPYITYVSLVPGLVVYRHPSRRSQPVARLDYPVLSTGYEAPELGGDWLRVVALDSSFQGYVEEKQLYNLAEMTLTIELKKGQFKITSVAPYD